MDPALNTTAITPIRRVSSLPERGVETVVIPDIPHSKSDTAASQYQNHHFNHQNNQSSDINSNHKLDRFGFILNMDSQGNVRDLSDQKDGAGGGGGSESGSAPLNSIQIQGRVEKWRMMLGAWDRFAKRRHRFVLKRARKGIPDTIRAQAWVQILDVPTKIREHPGLYDQLIRETIFFTHGGGGDDSAGSTSLVVSPTSSASAPSSPMMMNGSSPSSRNSAQNKKFKAIQDTIERDIHRTFPRHGMFYESDESTALRHAMQNAILTAQYNQKNALDNNGVVDNTNESDRKLSSLQPVVSPTAMNHHSEDNVSPHVIVEGKGGQASLRRVLKAYSMYDKEIGYCQGMNFIAGMFITVMSEEEAFWLLVGIMNDQPCHMRDLFGEGMRETHKVLHVAEKLIHQFLPKLSKHLEKEHIHVTMFATQWLLTIYASSFQFDLVTRVWDCFLLEGWKIAYRVMLAILQRFQNTMLRMGFEEILAFMRELPDKVEGGSIVDAAIQIPLRRSHIAKYEKEWLAQQPQQQPR